jgi:hypothetical protein
MRQRKAAGFASSTISAHVNEMADTPSPPNRFINADEAASFLGGLNPRTLTRWAREGYVPAIPLGEGKRRLWRFVEEDLEQWMLARRTGQGTLSSATDAPSGGFIH